MKISIILITIMSISLFPLISNADEIGAGFITNKIYSPERKISIDINYWYPTKNLASDFEFGNPKIFLTEKAKLNAELLAGKFPVILLAHGGMRASPYHSGWVASALAKSGYIVVVPQPPKSKSLKPSLAPNELWLRPSDLLLGLSSLEDLSMIINGVDKSNIFGLGFFLGGTSMLSLAGAKIDPNLYKNSCEEKGVNFDCQWFQKNGIDLKKISLKNIYKFNPDSRIKSVIAINPELTKTFNHNSVENIAIPSKIIELGNNSDDNHWAFKPNDYLTKNTNIELSNIPNSTLYSAFSICTKKGKIILATEGEEDICKEPQGLTREKIHNDILKDIVTTFKAISKAR